MSPSKQLWRFILQDVLLIILTIIAAIAALVAGAPPSIVAASAITFLFFLFYLIAMYQSNAQRSHKNHASIQAAQPQVHWNYQPEEWQSFIMSTQFEEQMRAQVQLWQPSLFRNAFIISIVVFLILALVYPEPGSTRLIAALIVSGGLYGLLVRSARRVQQSLRYPYGRSEHPPHIVISPVGAILGPQALLFKQPRTTIRMITITDTEPQTLHIQLEYEMGRQRTIPYNILIPIPKGQEVEAEMIRLHIRGT